VIRFNFRGHRPEPTREQDQGKGEVKGRMFTMGSMAGLREFHLPLICAGGFFGQQAVGIGLAGTRTDPEVSVCLGVEIL